MRLAHHPALLRIPAAGALFAGIVCGTLPAVTDGGSIVLAVVAAALISAAGSLLFGRRMATVFAVGALLGICSMEGHRLCAQFSGNYERELPPRTCGGTAELRIIDPRISELPGIVPPSLIRAQVRRIRLTGETQFRDVSGILYLKLPKESPPRLRCGDLLTAQGVFSLPAEGGAILRAEADASTRLEPMRNFAAHLAGRGATRVFRMREGAVTGWSPGVIGRICIVRDRLLERALRGMENERIRNLASALFFGTSGGVDPSSRSRLIETGTIHLYSVSGMHVAMLAAVLLIFLRPLPLRLRYLTLAGALLLYTLSTGANAPAMRAFWMIGLWCLCRSALLYIPALHALLLAGGILILSEPYLMLDMGFQYSFVITAILILAGERFDQLSELFGEEFRYMPASPFKQRREKHLRRAWALLFAVGACLAAFLGGVGISVYNQGLLLPGSVLANLALMPVVGILFPVLFFKLAAGAVWSGFDLVGAKLLEWSFRFMEGVTGIAAAGFERIPAIRPALPEIVLFYAALFVLLGTRRQSLARIAAALLILLPASWIVRAELHPAALFVAVGEGERNPAVVLHDPAADYTIAVNADGFETVAAAADFLLKRGATRIDRLHFTAARTGNLSALTQYTSRLPVGMVSVPELDRYSRTFRKRLAEELPDSPPAVRTGGDGGTVEIFPQKNGFELVYLNPCTTFPIRLLLENTDSGCLVTLRQPGKPEIRRQLRNSSVPEVWEHEFR